MNSAADAGQKYGASARRRISLERFPDGLVYIELGANGMDAMRRKAQWSVHPTADERAAHPAGFSRGGRKP